jgi:hypothetical protein
MATVIVNHLVPFCKACGNQMKEHLAGYVSCPVCPGTTLCHRSKVTLRRLVPEEVIARLRAIKSTACAARRAIKRGEQVNRLFTKGLTLNEERVLLAIDGRLGKGPVRWCPACRELSSAATHKCGRPTVITNSSRRCKEAVWQPQPQKVAVLATLQMQGGGSSAWAE